MGVDRSGERRRSCCSNFWRAVALSIVGLLRQSAYTSSVRLIVTPLCGAAEPSRWRLLFMSVPAIYVWYTLPKYLYVSRSHRQQGIGRALFREAQAIAHARGAQALYISATPTENTVNFYCLSDSRVHNARS